MGRQMALHDYRTWTSDSRRWRAYAPRPDDIVIATYPKSGTTWMQQITNLLIFQDTEPRAIGEISVWLDFRLGAPVENLLDRLERQAHRRFLKSHVPADAMTLHDAVKYVHVARDGRDTCLSYHNHCSNFSAETLARLDEIGHADPLLASPFPPTPEDPEAFFDRWLTTGVGDEADGYPFYSWFNFERTFWQIRRQPNVLMVHYRDLKIDLEGEMRRIARFLGIAVAEDLWPGLVRAATFAEMRRKGPALHPMLEHTFKGGAASFFHKGENDRWKSVLGAPLLAKFDEKLHAELSEPCQNWLQHGLASGHRAEDHPD